MKDKEEVQLPSERLSLTTIPYFSLIYMLIQSWALCARVSSSFSCVQDPLAGRLPGVVLVERHIIFINLAFSNTCTASIGRVLGDSRIPSL